MSSGDQDGADGGSSTTVEIEAIQVEFEGATGTKTITADSGFHVTLTDLFAIIKGDGPAGPYTYWVPRQRLIEITDVEDTRRLSGGSPSS